MGWQFVNPMAILNHQTGECRIGIERPATIAIIVLDILMNTVLTGIFVWQLRPALGSSAPRIFSFASDTAVCLGMLVTQWLTMRSADPETSLPASRASLVDERTDSEVSFVNEKPVPISRVLDKVRFNLR
ncbi:hypothetical protein J4E80_010972 [Alternaria sp. BMP 0032]|nr:hypothetical protein J4E80_010972 [Alternaria sp. BMP 0032]